MMAICSSEFDREDPNHKGYSMVEVDLYAGINFRFLMAGSPERNHRLQIWKNLTENKFELVRHYHDDQSNEVIFSDLDLVKVVERANQEWNKYHGSADCKADFYACDHKSPNRYVYCKIWPKQFEVSKRKVKGESD